MDAKVLKGHIVNKTPEKFYIFTGPEWKIQWIYIEKMQEAFNKQYKYIDSISSIYSKLTNRSFISQSYIYVVRDDSDLLTNEKLQDQIENILQDNILILLLTNPDKRTKFYKKYEDKICTFDYLPANILSKYVQKEIQLSNPDYNKLMEICEYDYGRCLLEIDKIKRYVNYLGPAPMFDGVFEKLLKEGTIYIPPKDAIFDFVDAILDDNTAAFDLYEQCKAVNEATMVIISVLYTNAKATLQVQSYKGNDIQKATGLNYYQVNNAKQHIGKRSNRELINIMKLCQKCQEGIVRGMMEEEFIVDYILGEIL